MRTTSPTLARTKYIPEPTRWRLDDRPFQLNVLRPAESDRASWYTQRPCMSKTPRSTSEASGRSSVKFIPPADGFGHGCDIATTGTPTGSGSALPSSTFLLAALIWMLVVAEPESAFAATNLTENVPVSLAPGFQVNVPPVFVAFGVNVAPLFAGIFTATMVSDVIASPSESDAETVNVTTCPLTDFTVAGAMTTGACGVGTTVPGSNSSAPMSPNATAPSPWFALAGSSMRAAPIASVAGQLSAVDEPASIAGEPASRRKSPAAAFVNLGSAPFECGSGPPRDAW